MNDAVWIVLWMISSLVAALFYGLWQDAAVRHKRDAQLKDQYLELLEGQRARADLLEQELRDRWRRAKRRKK